MSYPQWNALSTQAQEQWDLTDDKSKGVILGNTRNILTKDSLPKYRDVPPKQRTINFLGCDTPRDFNEDEKTFHDSFSELFDDDCPS